MKIGLAHCEILGGICQFFYISFTDTQLSHVHDLLITGLKFTIFLHDVGPVFALLMPPLALRYSNPFRSASEPNEGI